MWSIIKSILAFILFLCMGVYLLSNGISTRNKGIEVEATVDRIVSKKRRAASREVDYYVYISYEFKGKKYEDIEYDAYSFGVSEGKTITVKVDENNPTHVYTSSWNMAGGIFMLVCSAIIGVTIVLEIKELRAKK